ncbi:MAG: Rpn family recombination-promoting nuclease/putative transposase [Lachnospiraceae bacterium]|nr:Rpn family recombination-promoting nuclease/putative transposase [Lachnospiraceae bacterium]
MTVCGGSGNLTGSWFMDTQEKDIEQGLYMTAIWLDYFKNSDRNERKQKGYRLSAVIPIVLYNGERRWTASHRFRKMVGQESLFGKYVVDFEYVLVSASSLAASKIKNSNTLVDNILLADKKNTKKAWSGANSLELVRRIRQMEKDDLNEWITWFSNVIRELNGEERKKVIQQLREGDEKIVCSSFERIMKKEKEEGKAEDVIELLEDIGEPSGTLKKHIMSQTDIEVLRKWHKAASKAESIEDFEKTIGLVQT